MTERKQNNKSAVREAGLFIWRYSDANTHTDCETEAEARNFQRLQNGGTVERISKLSEIVPQFEALGFNVEDTGGGCQWLRLQLTENVSLVITDGEASLPDLTAQLFVICGEHSDPLAHGCLMSSTKLLDLIWKSGIGL